MRGPQFSEGSEGAEGRGRESRGEGRGEPRGGPRGGRRGHGHGPGPRGRGFGRPGGWQQADLPDASDAAAWFAGRLPSAWFIGTPNVTVDREEILVVGELEPPVVDGDDDTKRGAAAGRASRFREDTRDERVAIAQEAQARYGRSVAWGVTIDGDTSLFTHLAVPVMTRLRQPERQVLDTLVDAGVARSRSEALAWSVKLVGEHTSEWLGKLREAMNDVDTLRSEGPQL